MRTTLASILFVTLALAGCGGKSKPMTDPCKDKMMEGEHHDEGMEGEGENHDEPPMTPEMSDFHGVLSPLWHAEAGQARTDGTCDASGKMLDLGVHIQDAGAPEGVDADQWAAAVQTLMVTITQLQDACPVQPGGASFDDAFHAVHEAFHGLLDLLPKA